MVCCSGVFSEMLSHLFVQNCCMICCRTFCQTLFMVLFHNLFSRPVFSNCLSHLFVLNRFLLCFSLCLSYVFSGMYGVLWNDSKCHSDDSRLLHERNLMESLDVEVPELVDYIE
jgi:hypothetical protein